MEEFLSLVLMLLPGWKELLLLPELRSELPVLLVLPETLLQVLKSLLLPVRLEL